MFSMLRVNLVCDRLTSLKRCGKEFFLFFHLFPSLLRSPHASLTAVIAANVNVTLYSNWLQWGRIISGRCHFLFLSCSYSSAAAGLFVVGGRLPNTEV